MRLLFITRKFPPSTGGMETFAYDLQEALSQKAEVSLISWGRSNKYLPLVLPYFFCRATYELIKGKIDIIHAQDGIVSVLAWLLSKLSRKPYGVVIHGLDITYKNRLFQAVIPRTVSSAGVIFCISQAAADEAIGRGASADKTVVIPLGITDDLHQPRAEARRDLRQWLAAPADAKLLLTVGRLVERKGVAWFTEEAMPAIAKSHPDAIYLVVGEGENRPKIEAAIAKNKLADKVRLLGRLDDDLMSMLYNGADIFVQPNIVVSGDIEGFGRVLLEASLCELPVVASGIEGIKDAVVDGRNGVLVESQNPVAFQAAISRFLDDNDLAQKFGKASRQFTLENYNWEAMADRYLKEYRKLLQK